jgi:hypothetical protein
MPIAALSSTPQLRAAARRFPRRGRSRHTSFALCTIRVTLGRFAIPGVGMRAALLVPLLFALTACGTAGLPLLPAHRVRASFPPPSLVNTGPADVIIVDALDRLPLRRADLVAPDGAITAASAIEVNPAPGFSKYQAPANFPYGGAFSGLGPHEKLLPVPVGAAPQVDSRLLEMHSLASIALPDPIAYSRDWRHYRIRLTFGTPPAPLARETIAAPAPPPAG